MELSKYQIITLVLLIFDTYIVYKYMRALFHRNNANKIIELITYIVYYVLLCAIFLFENMPIIISIYSFISLIGLSYNYQASLSKRVWSSALICAIQITVEWIIYVPCNNFLIDLHRIDYNSYPTWEAITVRIANYIAVYMFSNHFNLRNEANLPTRFWVSIILVPITSVLSYILSIGIPKIIFGMKVSLILILITNFSVVYLYEAISAAFTEKYNQILIAKQNEYYNNQFELMKNSIKVRNDQKHDLRNHLSAIDTLLHMNESGKAIEHISTMMDLCEVTREYSSSGNVVIDSILNYKIQEAEQNGIAVNIELSIPECLGIISFDMTVILGNIIDNAINATKELEKDKNINLIIKYNKGRLIIKINNPFNGEVKYENNRLVTLHKDKNKHGIGLNNVLATLEKYSGSMEIEHLNNIFSVMILMFV